MSNSLAIAALTAVLRKLLEDGTKLQDDGVTPDPELTDLQVTTQPPDKARGNNNFNQLNIFLYQALYNPAFRNMDMPRQVRPGEISPPPLPLTLYYLITAYGQNNEDVLSHRMIGRAMRILHDYPLITPSDLISQTELQSLLSQSGLDLQLERIRITPQPMTLEEMSKLWVTFQTQYRISAAYQVSVVLIEGRQGTKSSLPVLKRGSEDAGPSILAETSPSIKEIIPPQSQPSARLGENLVIHGHHLKGEGITVRFRSGRLQDPLELEPLPGATDTRIEVHLPSTAEDASAISTWISGFYTLSLVVRRPQMPSWATNELSFALAPVISISPLNAPAGTVNMTVTCTPRLAPGQRAILIFGHRQIPVQTINTPSDLSQPSTLTFSIPNATAGTYLVRLRIDGVDSLPVFLSGIPPTLEFDPLQKVTIT